MIDKSFWIDKKVFLTGHTGFKGSWLSIWLNKLGAQVCGYALEPNTEPSLFKQANVDNLMESIIGDIRDLEYLKQMIIEFQPDIIIHLAAQPIVRESYANPVDTYAINVMGTVNLLEAARECDSIKAIVNVTTDKVYENKEWVKGYRETDRLGGYDPYSNSKTCSEFITSSYINSFFNPNLYAQHGVAIATARAGNVIGGGDWAKDRLIPDIFRALENNRDIEIRNPNAVRPWQHVLEPLAGYMMLCEKLYKDGSKWTGAWNFGPVISETKDVMYIVEYIKNASSGFVEYKIQEGDQVHETNLLNLDCTKSVELLKWQPKWNIEQTLMNIINWHESVNSGKQAYEMCLEQIEEYMNEG
ncbi:CDP-glucose 4,6-dehydratase [Lysinibacillus sp. NPDC097214]|uniref:CDP-glucose 4,6-dehydratase n=1 Tax=Lysinibacillus sp. NPDC097214 TaxID=3390584 RepID=UPI003CFF27BD